MKCWAKLCNDKNSISFDSFLVSSEDYKAEFAPNLILGIFELKPLLFLPGIHGTI